MRFRKFFPEIGDSSEDISERLFKLLVLIGMVGLAAGIIVGILSGESAVNNIALAAALLIFGTITYFTIRFHRIQLGAVIMVAIILYVVMPFNFITTGGIYGGAPIWFLFSLFYVCLVIGGKIKYVLLVSAFMVYAALYFIAYRYPALIVPHTTEMAYIDSLATLAIVTVITCGMVLYQNASYRVENETAKRQKKEIEELNHMQNRFFSSMSHEIRTPINTIIGLNEMILRETNSEEVAADARDIQSASKMLLALINDILDMSKIESGKMVIVPVTYDVGAMLSDIVNMVWVRAREKGLEFHVDVDRAMPAQLYGDEVRIKQVLLNILNNAVKYTSEGSVTLSIQCEKTDDSSVRVVYSVTDTGMGVKRENIPYLFSAFKRVDEEKNRYIEGTGLGLAIVKQLLELMGGDIAVNSVYTKGSTFVATIPQGIVGESRMEKLDLETRHSGNVRKHYKQSFEAPDAHILVVDDNEANLLVVKKLLKETKVQIDTAENGAEALEKTLQSRYDVIFMDHLMPVMDGIACLRAIRTQTGGLNQNATVVALTANAGGENQSLYRREGFDGYLLKPVSGAQLEAELLSRLPASLVKVTNEEGFAGVIETPVLTHRTKLPILISADSVCDLPGYITEKRQIAIMPYRVITDGGEFLDGVEVETDGCLLYMDEGGRNVHSEAPEIEDYSSFFAEQLTKAQYVIHIAMAKKSSHGFANASEAAKMFDNVFVVNSGHLSSGMGLMAMQASVYAAEGMKAEKIVENLEAMRDRIQTSFIVDSTEYLARTGRVSEAIHQICNALMLHPVIILKNSSMRVSTIMIGTRNRVWRKYIKRVLKGAGEIDRKNLFITYAGLADKELAWIAAEVKKLAEFENIIYQKASPAISINCGPGSFGLLFLLRR